MKEKQGASASRLLVLTIASIALGAWLEPTGVRSARAPFYAGKTVYVEVGSTAGGDSSNYALALAHDLGQHIPGNPNVVIQYVPGAGGLVAANEIYNTAPRDGTTIGITSRAFVTSPIIGAPGAYYDSRKFGWLGSSSAEYSVCFSWKSSPVKTVQDLMSKELIVGSAGQAGTANVFAELANRFAGMHIKTINGYPGSTEAILALERGEVQGYCGLSWSYIKLRKPEWLDDKDINLLFQMGPQKRLDLRNVPFLPDLASAPSGEAVIKFVLATQEIGRPFFTTPGVPQARLRILQDAFAATLQDPRYKRDADKMGLDVDYVSATRAQAIVNELYSQPQAVINGAASVMK